MLKNRRFVSLGACALAAVGLGGALLLTRGPAHAEAAAKAKAETPALKLAASRIAHATVYQNNALVTREVEIPEGTGVIELVVSPLPPETVNTSLYSEGGEGLRVLNTRFRLRPVKEDTREEVRKLETQLRELQTDAAKLQSDAATVQQNMQMITKLEGFTSANATASMEKGKLDGDQIITLSDYVMKQRGEKAKELVELQEKQRENREQTEFVQRQLREVTAGTSKVERDAVIVVDKDKAGAAKVRLNYLVGSAGWRPQYRFRASNKDEKEAVQVEYLAGLIQQTGEDWSNVGLTLSTAQPLLNAGPPDLSALHVALVPHGTPPMPGVTAQPDGRGGFANARDVQQELRRQAGAYRSQSNAEFNMKKGKEGGRLVNDAAALEQSSEILWTDRDQLQANRDRSKQAGGGFSEGQSVTYHLPTKLNVPSRNEEQVIEVTRLDMKPEYYYKAVPVLTQHVYRLANLTNQTKYVLLPGEATMYIGTDFVGRLDLPLVAIGEQFTAGFGVDPQLQVQRVMLDKVKSQQGGNQVLKYDYRILVSSYKPEPVTVQVWDRLPRGETETINVTVMKSQPEVCTDPIYVREHKPNNLLRWDLKVEPKMNGEKALAIHYEFKIEHDRQMGIGGFQSR